MITPYYQDFIAWWRKQFSSEALPPDDAKTHELSAAFEAGRKVGRLVAEEFDA